MMVGRLRLQYIEDTNTITQLFDYFPGYIIVVVYNKQGDLVDLVCEDTRNLD
jgi:hypothetical protein